VNAAGSRNLDQAVIADFDGDGRPEVVLPRLSRDGLVGLQPDGARFLDGASSSAARCNPTWWRPMSTVTDSSTSRWPTAAPFTST